jgi:hypothetical protein
VCNLAGKRCAEFKLNFKPKVAQAAVSCLRRLKGNELRSSARERVCPQRVDGGLPGSGGASRRE